MAIPRPNPWKNVPHVGPLIDDVQTALDPAEAVQWEDMLMYGLASARPAADIVGRYYYASDTQTAYRDNGTSWDELIPKPPIALIVALGG